MRTCTAIDTEIMRVIEMTKIQPCNALLAWQASAQSTAANSYVGIQRSAMAVTQRKRKRSCAIDSGANISLFYDDLKDHIKNRRRSRTMINVASDDYMHGVHEGEITMKVEGASEDIRMNLGITTAEQLSRELFSIDYGYMHQGMNVLLVQPDFAFKCNECGHRNEIGGPQMLVGPEQKSVSLRYNLCEGGFWLDYDVETQVKAHSISMVDDRMSEPVFTREQTIGLVDKCYAHSGVTEVLVAQHQDDREIRGVKSRLRNKQQQMTANEFHKLYSHIGCSPGCEVCVMMKGCMRRIYKVI